MAQNRDDDSGEFTEQYPRAALLEAIEILDPATTARISEEVRCSYDLAYRRLNTLADEEANQRTRVGGSFVWSRS